MAQQVPETTLCAIDTLINARVQEILMGHDLTDDAFEVIRSIARDAYRQGLLDGVKKVGKLAK